jgi:glycosyltransferase involved in cell wall biosynthesis
MGGQPGKSGGAVLLSGHPWQGFPYGLHHVARALADSGRSVLFVEPPFSPLHLLSGRRRGRVATRKPRPSGEQGIWLFSPFTLLPHQNLPLLRSRFLLDRWPDFCLSRLAAAVRETPFERPEFLISGTSLFSTVALTLPTAMRAFRLADDERLFGGVPPAMQARTLRDLPGFDVVFATTRPLAEMAKAAGARRVVLMPNGFDPGRFAEAKAEAVPADLAGIPSPRIVYAGAMEEWFDWEALCTAAAAMHEAAFILIGRPSELPAGLPSNIRFLGPKPYEAVPAYMAHCDVGIIPFRHAARRDALAAVDPIKLWEYLAAGLPVVAGTDLSLPDLPVAVRAYGPPEELAAALKAALAGGRGAVAGLDLAHRTWPAIVEKALAEAAT